MSPILTLVHNDYMKTPSAEDFAQNRWRNEQGKQQTRQSVPRKRLAVDYESGQPNRSHLRTEPDDIETREHSTRALNNLKASANESISRLMDLPKHLQNTEFAPRSLERRARSIAQTIQSLNCDTMEKQTEASRIRELTIRYEQRERRLLEQLDTSKRMQLSCSEETEALRKIIGSLQHELSVGKDRYGTTSEQKHLRRQNDALKEELAELREQLSRSRVVTNSDAYRYRNQAIEMRQHVERLEGELDKLEQRIRAESQNSRAAQHKVCQMQKQSAQLVLQNCQLRSELEQAAKQVQYARQAAEELQNERVVISGLQAKIKLLEQQKQLLERYNLATSFNLTGADRGERRQLEARGSMLNSRRQTGGHIRIKTQADSKGFQNRPQRSSFGTYERRSSKPQVCTSITEKERLNDAVVRRCKLTLAPR